MPSRIQECYRQPLTIGAIFGDPEIVEAETLLQFRGRLDGTGVAYTLHTPDSAFSLPEPRSPACRGLPYDRVMYLIIDRSRRKRTLQRFRLFLDGDRPVCIEDDFAHKNPYQS